MDSESWRDSLIKRFLEDRAALIGYLRMLLPHDLVEDAFQETFIVVNSKLEHFDRSRPFGPWVRGIGRNVAKQVYAKAGRAVPLPPEIVLDLIDRALDDFEESDEDQSDLLYLRACLEQLNESNQALLRQRYHDGLSLADLADRTGRSSGAVQVALSRLRSSLAACIERRRSAE